MNKLVLLSLVLQFPLFAMQESEDKGYCEACWSKVIISGIRAK